MSASSIAYHYGRDWVSFEQAVPTDSGSVASAETHLRFEAHQPVHSVVPIDTGGVAALQALPQTFQVGELCETESVESRRSTAVVPREGPSTFTTPLRSETSIGSLYSVCPPGVSLPRGCMESDIPRLQAWTTEKVARWVATVPVGGGVDDVFREHEVNGAVLESLTEQDLLTMGIVKFGWRRQLLLSRQELVDSLEEAHGARAAEITKLDTISSASTIGGDASFSSPRSRPFMGILQHQGSAQGLAAQASKLDREMRRSRNSGGAGAVSSSGSGSGAGSGECLERQQQSPPQPQPPPQPHNGAGPLPPTFPFQQGIMSEGTPSRDLSPRMSVTRLHPISQTPLQGTPQRSRGRLSPPAAHSPSTGSMIVSVGQGLGSPKLSCHHVAMSPSQASGSAQVGSAGCVSVASSTVQAIGSPPQSGSAQLAAPDGVRSPVVVAGLLSPGGPRPPLPPGEGRLSAHSPPHGSPVPVSNGLRELVRGASPTRVVPTFAPQSPPGPMATPRFRCGLAPDPARSGLHISGISTAGTSSPPRATSPQAAWARSPQVSAAAMKACQQLSSAMQVQASPLRRGF